MSQSLCLLFLVLRGFLSSTKIEPPNLLSTYTPVPHCKDPKYLKHRRKTKKKKNRSTIFWKILCAFMQPQFRKPGTDPPFSFNTKENNIKLVYYAF